MSGAETILIFRIGQLGDTVASLPAITAIRAAHPAARVVLLTDRHQGLQAVSAWDVVAPTGLVDDVCFLQVPASAADYLALAVRIRKLRPSRLYYLPPMPRTASQIRRDRIFFAGLCGIRRIAGLRPTKDYPVRGADGRLVPMDREWRRLLEWIAADLPAGAITAAPPRIEPRGQDRRRARELLAAAGFEGRRVVGFGPGSKMPAKTWSAEKFEAVGHALLQQDRGVRLVVLGGPHERALGDRLCGVWGAQASRNACGELIIWETAALLERCAAYVGNDTGTMHVAAAVGTPCVAIFSARENPGKWDPAGEGHTVLRADVPCAGCMLFDCIEQQNACLTAVSVADVLQAVLATLNRPVDRECLHA